MLISTSQSDKALMLNQTSDLTAKNNSGESLHNIFMLLMLLTKLSDLQRDVYY